MKKNYILIVLLILFQNLLISQNKAFHYSNNKLLKIESLSSNINNDFEANKEIIDSSAIYLKVDSSFLISDEIFWDTMLFFYFKYDELDRPTERLSESLLNTYSTGIKQVFEKAYFYYSGDDDKIIKEISLRLRPDGLDFDTLTFYNFYNELGKLDSVYMDVLYLGERHLVRRDYYLYDENNILQRKNRFVLDEKGNWVLGLLFNYYYNSEISKPSVIVRDNYYQNKMTDSEKDSIIYNSYGQKDSIYYSFKSVEDNNWQINYMDEFYYSSSEFEFPDSIRSFNILEGDKDLSSVQYFFRRHPNYTSNVLKSKFICNIPNPYTNGQLINCNIENNIDIGSLNIEVYNINGQRVFKMPFKNNIALKNINKSGQYIFVIRDKEKMLFADKFVYHNNK